jgi:hypothetical protein
MRRLAAVMLLCALPLPARADRVDSSAALVTADAKRRGLSSGDTHLALASLYARALRQRETLFHLAEARKTGIAASRIDLLLGSFYRSVGRFDAAFSTLVRVLVRHEEQPFALVQLWKALYECKLRAAQVKTDTDSIRERLAASGLHFPAEFKLAPDAATKAKRLTASAYNALLADKAQFAAELFQAAIDAFPSEPQAHRGLGIARARGHDFTRAAGAYLLYLELAPNAPDADEVDRVLMEYWKTRCKGCSNQ